MKINKYLMNCKGKNLIFIVLAVFLLPGYSSAEDIVISEVMFNPNGNENAREFVEIQNLSDEEVSLEGFIVSDGSGFDTLIPIENGSWIVHPGSYAVILDPDYFTADEPYDIPEGIRLFTVEDKAIGLRGLSNSNAEPVYLISAVGDTLSMVTYSLDCPPGHSWERIIPHGGDSMENYKPSKYENGTPGQKNSATPEPYNPALDESNIRFRPEQPHMGNDLEIILSYRNAGLETVSDISIQVWMLPDIKAGAAVFSKEVNPGGTSEEVSLYVQNLPGGRLAFTAAIVQYDTALTDYDTVTVILDVTVPEGTILLNEVMAAPRKDSPEWVEVYNQGNNSVDLYNWSIGDSRGESFGLVNGHFLIAPNGYAVISGGQLRYDVPGISHVIIVGDLPAFNNDEDGIKLFDFSTAQVDSMNYTDAQPGYSFELISPDMRGKLSGWDVCVDPSGATPGKMNSIHYANVPEDKGSKSNQLSLTVNPNPFSDMVKLSYHLPFPLARVRLYVYDRRGRLVKKIRDADESGSEWSGTWKGRSNGSRLPVGPYILNLETFEKRSGKVYSERKTIVIGRNL